MRLLLVEDDALLADSMITSLSRHGFTVDWLAKGSHVVRALNEERFSAVILDLTLPDLDGLTVLRQLRHARHQLPVLILTARDDIQDRVKGLDAGADDYLGKPFAVEELIARLNVQIRRQSGSADELIILGVLTLSFSEQILKENNIPVKLTKNEFKIVSELILNTGKVISKEQLQQSLHGWDEFASDNAIEVHIHNLRKKIPTLDIKNIRGVGYLIEKSK